MTLRTYLALMTVATLIAWLGFGIVVLTIDPTTTNWLGIGLFYITLLVCLMGTAAIIGFVVRFLFLRHELIARSVVVAFRQGFLVALLVTIILFFLAHNLFNTLNVILVILGLTALEFLLLSLESDRSKVNP
jgi:signal transduction histidine kinase